MEHINHLTKKQYQGDSQKLLSYATSVHQFTSNEWMTAYQGKQAGYHVTKGSKGTRLYRIIESKDIVREGSKYSVHQAEIEYYTVFNLNQFTKIEETATPKSNNTKQY